MHRLDLAFELAVMERAYLVIELGDEGEGAPENYIVISMIYMLVALF
jgi:hypothetical protein